MELNFMKLYSKDGGKTSIFGPSADSDINVKEKWLLEKISFLGLNKSFYSKDEIAYIENVIKNNNSPEYIACLKSAEKQSQKNEKKSKTRSVIIFLIIFIPGFFVIKSAKNYFFGGSDPVGEYYQQGVGAYSDEEYITTINDDGTFISVYLENGKEDLDLRIKGTWMVKELEENTTRDQKSETYIFFKNFNNQPYGAYRFDGCISGCDDSDLILLSNNGYGDYIGSFMEGGVSVFGNIPTYDSKCPE